MESVLASEVASRATVLSTYLALENPGKRIGIEPGTGEEVILKRTPVEDFGDRIEEIWHGYVPRKGKH